MRAGRLKAEAVETKNSTRALAIIGGERPTARSVEAAAPRRDKAHADCAEALSRRSCRACGLCFSCFRARLSAYTRTTTRMLRTPVGSWPRSAAYKVVPIIPFPTTTQVLQSKDTFYPRVARVHSTIVCGGHEHFDRRVAIIRHRLSDLSSTGLRQLGGVMDVVNGFEPHLALRRGPPPGG